MNTSSNPHTPTVAVCLAAFNGVRYLPQQLESILNQMDVGITVFVSVDRSSDGTEDWVADVVAKNASVVLLPVGKVFGGAARNFFRLLQEVDFSKFDFVAYADQDDIWLPGKLKRAVDTLGAGNAEGYSSDVVAFWDSGKSTYIRKSYPQRRRDYLFESAGPGCTFVIRQQLAVDIQRELRKAPDAFADIGLHDWFTYAYARSHGYRWIIDNYAGLMYRQHAENQVGVNTGWAAFLWRARKVLSGWGLDQARLIARRVGLEEDAFVRRWSGGGRRGLLALAMHAPQCRRRPRDRWLFALSCLGMAIVGWK